MLLTANLDHAVIAARIRSHRAIGVVYHLKRERGNYVPMMLPERYDAFIYIDRSEALHPLLIKPETHEPPETYPWGLEFCAGRQQRICRGEVSVLG